MCEVFECWTYPSECMHVWSVVIIAVWTEGLNVGMFGC